jgi:hypothetical protein
MWKRSSHGKQKLPWRRRGEDKDIKEDVKARGTELERCQRASFRYTPYMFEIDA